MIRINLDRGDIKYYKLMLRLGKYDNYNTLLNSVNSHKAIMFLYSNQNN